VFSSSRPTFQASVHFESRGDGTVRTKQLLIHTLRWWALWLGTKQTVIGADTRGGRRPHPPPPTHTQSHPSIHVHTRTTHTSRTTTTDHHRDSQPWQQAATLFAVHGIRSAYGATVATHVLLTDRNCLRWRCGRGRPGSLCRGRHLRGQWRVQGGIDGVAVAVWWRACASGRCRSFGGRSRRRWRLAGSHQAGCAVSQGTPDRHA
jgi:hypothetical protein